jgi:hypothetical protein
LSGSAVLSVFFRWEAIVKIPVNKTIRAVWNSGLSTESPLTRISWLDNDTITFSANNGPKPRTPEEIHTRETWLYLWRLGNKPRPFGADAHTAAFGCAARGEVTYYQKTIDPKTGGVSRTRWVEVPGQESRPAPLTDVMDRKVTGIAANPVSIEPTDCGFYIDPAMAGKVYVTDTEHAFYIDFGNDPIMTEIHDKPAEPLVLMRADGSGRVELPISNSMVALRSVHFHTFDGYFYLLNSNVPPSIWRETNCWPIWRIEPPTAKTERLCIPFGPWLPLELIPTKAGLFFSANSPKDESGFYRLDNGVASRIFAGDLWGSIISPDGCRVAFTRPDSDRSIPGVSWSSIIVVDVCSPKPDASSAPN